MSIRSWLLLLPAALAPLAACNQPSSAGEGLVGRGRFVAIGHFPPGRAWPELAAAQPGAATAAARPGDDQQILVVMDSQTGEVRECGDLSGVCLSMTPWAKQVALGQTAPVQMQRHVDQLAAQATAAQVTAPPPPRPAPRPHPVHHSTPHKASPPASQARAASSPAAQPAPF